ncbi:MAG: T9SS type A sorting domain-containing protein [Flavobacteriales bacterium]|nr:T9SS type A sorting domain-containing protein [Flavobacteriales bacterium]MCB9167998.1 T9SS type A sorting domain-containing protein [Flavobacteriales bacterium]
MHLRTLPALLSLFCASFAGAQVTITDNEMPHAGDQTVRTRAFLAPFIDIATTGPGANWDYAYLQANTQDVSDQLDVSSTNIVYALIYADLFFNPNRANVATAGVDIPFYQLLPITDPYTFFYRSQDEFKKVGFGAQIAGIPAPIIFDQKDVIYELPLDYGNTSDSHSAWQVNVPNLAYYGYQQDRHNEVDGWGTISTPSGTYDAIRVRTTLLGQDTIAIDTLSVGFTIDRPTVHEYKWLSPGHRVPVLQVNTLELFGAELVTDIWFYDEPRAIEVVQPLSASLCPGQSLDVTYDATGAYNAGGLLIPANHFIAQLSDASGDFSNAVDIGSVTSNVDGTITVTIPLGTPFGTGYRIRVISDSPSVTGTDNGFDIAIGVAPVAGIMVNAPTDLCAGDHITLQAQPDMGVDWQWQVEGTDIPGAVGATYDAATTGAYTVIIANTCGTDTSQMVAVQVNDLPEHTLDTTTITTCAGIAAALSAIDVSGQSPLSYQWLLDGQPVPGGTAIDLQAMAEGMYTLMITNTNTGCQYTTDAVSVDVDTIPAPVILAQDTTAFCAGASVGLVTDLVPGAGYQWSLDGAPLPNDTTTQVVVSDGGDYSVTITDQNGCMATSAPETVTVHPLPTQPVIAQSVDTLFTSGNGTFQWSLYGIQLPGETDSLLLTGVPGDYTVTITDANGCSSTSDPYMLISTGLSHGVQGNVAVYPIPSDGRFTLLQASGTYQVYDAMGRPVQQGTVTSSTMELDLTSAGAGAYLLRLADGPTTFRLIIR